MRIITLFRFTVYIVAEDQPQEIFGLFRLRRNTIITDSAAVLNFRRIPVPSNFKGGGDMKAIKPAKSESGFSNRFIRKDTPSFQVPPSGGDRYEALVPDTLDIQQRCRLAVNGLTGATDPEKDYMLYFGVNFRSNPPSMHHGGSDNNQAKFMEFLPLMRIACGSHLNDHVDPICGALDLPGPEGAQHEADLGRFQGPGHQGALPFAGRQDGGGADSHRGASMLTM